jgi:hypothetical protein
MEKKYNPVKAYQIRQMIYKLNNNTNKYTPHKKLKDHNVLYDEKLNLYYLENDKQTFIKNRDEYFSKKKAEEEKSEEEKSEEEEEEDKNNKHISYEDLDKTDKITFKENLNLIEYLFENKTLKTNQEIMNNILSITDNINE